MTIDMNYYCAMAFLLMALFALIGFALGRNRSLGALLGIFFAYVVADKSAEFIRDVLNLILRLELGDEIIPYFKGIIFFVAVVGVVGCLFETSYTHSFEGRLRGMLTGILTGYFVSIFALEFLRGILVGWPGDQTVMFDFSYDLLDQEGLFVITINFLSGPEGAYVAFRKALVPAMLVILFVILGRAFQGFAKVLSKIWDAVLKWVSIKSKGKKEEAKAT